MQTTYKLVDFAMSCRFEDLSAEVVDSVKKQVLDTLATSLAGGAQDGIAPLRDLVSDWGGKPESSVINFAGRYPAPHAAMLNAAMAHALDYDDTHEDARCHPAVVAVPTALAIAQAGGGVTGRDLITAIAVGVDVHCRMARAAKLAKPNVLQGGWHFTTLFGYFSAAVIAARLKHCDRETMINAFGIAYHQAAGNLQCIVDGSLVKRMGPGFAARGGITAVEMARRGITGPKDVIDSELGIFKLYHAGFDEQSLLHELGTAFASAGTSFKPYPCCRLNHPYLDGMLQLVREHDVKPEEIIEIVPTIAPWVQLLTEPAEVKLRPNNIVDSQFSLPWSLACAAVRRKAGLAEYDLGAIADPALLAMAQRVKPFLVATATASSDSPVMIKVATTRGDFEVTTSGHMLGSPKNSLSLEFLEDKFFACAARAPNALSNDALKQIVATVRNLERLDDAATLAAAVAG